jgi:hypothetical protein
MDLNDVLFGSVRELSMSPTNLIGSQIEGVNFSSAMPWGMGVRELATRAQFSVSCSKSFYSTLLQCAKCLGAGLSLAHLRHIKLTTAYVRTLLELYNISF